MSGSGLQEGKQVGVELLLVGAGEAVRGTGVDLELPVLASHACEVNGQPWLNTTGCPLPQSL
jgi:hypothetical protein